MDLLTSLVTEFEIPIIRKDQKIWFFRTKAGKYYYDFRRNSFIALGWDLISPELITDSNQGKEAKKAEIEKLYPDEKRPGLIFGQMDVFYNQMHAGDLVIIPSEGTKLIAIGKIGGLADEIERKPDNSDYDRCSFTHKRNVEWLKKVESWQDVYLFKALRAQQTISDITEDAKLVFRNLFPVYIFENTIHLSVQKPTQAELSLASNVELLTSIIQISDVTAKLYGKKSFSDEMHIKTAVGSPGFLEIIWPEIPVAAISVALVAKSVIGKQKGADGSITDGVMAIITKANELINDHHTRKKIDAETQKIMAEAHLAEAQVAKINVEMEEIHANADKACAEAELMRAQAAKANAEARSLEQENEQIILLPSGMTTEEARIDNERLNIPVDESVNTAVAEITTSGIKMRNAAVKNGLSYGGQKIEKIS